VYRGSSAELVVVGAGAAGLATAIFAARAAPHARVACLDGARKIGAKILVSGGSRCNVTNRVVTERDFWGGSAAVVRRVLRAFPASSAVGFFAELGVALHEEEDGKLFPDSNSSRTVLDALLREAERCGVAIAAGERVSSLDRHEHGFVVHTAARTIAARSAVLATGGCSLPKTGSDGFGYELARRLGHGCVATTPALAPLLLDSGEDEAHFPYAALAGVTHQAEMTLWRAGRVERRLAGSLLWTHFGVSGPLALNMSRHWHRATLARDVVRMTLNVCPGDSHESLDAWVRDRQRMRPRAHASSVLATRLPAAIANAALGACGVEGGTTMAHLTREDRRRLVRMLVEAPIAVVNSRGYQYAEVTAGGVPLDEIEPSTLQSRFCGGLYFAGEILDVDGRLGGFNFQWAWSSAWVAAQAIAVRLRE
jgi:predicted Rossmann fold flavoprotein